MVELRPFSVMATGLDTTSSIRETRKKKQNKKGQGTVLKRRLAMKQSPNVCAQESEAGQRLAHARTSNQTSYKYRTQGEGSVSLSSFNPPTSEDGHTHRLGRRDGPAEERRRKVGAVKQTGSAQSVFGPLVSLLSFRTQPTHRPITFLSLLAPAATGTIYFFFLLQPPLLLLLLLGYKACIAINTHTHTQQLLYIPVFFLGGKGGKSEWLYSPVYIYICRHPNNGGSKFGEKHSRAVSVADGGLDHLHFLSFSARSFLFFFLCSSSSSYTQGYLYRRGGGNKPFKKKKKEKKTVKKKEKEFLPTHGAQQLFSRCSGLELEGHIRNSGQKNTYIYTYI